MITMAKYKNTLESAFIIVKQFYLGPSEKVVRISGILYKFPKEKVCEYFLFNENYRFVLIEKSTYAEAKSKCEKVGMTLAAVEGEEEMKNIIDYLSYTGELEIWPPIIFPISGRFNVESIISNTSELNNWHRSGHIFHCALFSKIKFHVD